MKSKYRNLFLLFGLAAIVFMIVKADWSVLADVNVVRRAALYLPAVIGIWVGVYLFNAQAFRLAVNTASREKHCRLSFLHSLKLTISGFAFSYITPFGFGGGPYRVMEMRRHIGDVAAIGAVAAYSMMHILSHFCLWFTAAVLFSCVYRMTPWLWTMFALFALICAGIVYFFFWGYRNGLIHRLYRLSLSIPLLKRPARKFYARHKEDIEQVDVHIANLHASGKTFYSALLCEYVARLINSWEYVLILRALGMDVGFIDGIVALAFSSLLGNLLFFLPMQAGAREGGLMLAVNKIGQELSGMGAAATLGVLAGLYTRVRELFWVAVGVSLVKIGNGKLLKHQDEEEHETSDPNRPPISPNGHA